MEMCRKGFTTKMNSSSDKKLKKPAVGSGVAAPSILSLVQVWAMRYCRMHAAETANMQWRLRCTQPAVRCAAKFSVRSRS